MIIWESELLRLDADRPVATAVAAVVLVGIVTAMADTRT